MEFDDLKAAWQSLERKLERESQIQMAMLRQHKAEGLRGMLRPLRAGMVLQIAFGLVVILLASWLWSGAPTAAPVIAAGVLVQAYGVAAVITAALVLSAIDRVDYGAPVLEMQAGLARAQRVYAIGMILAGLSWWYLWIPVLMVLAALAGVNLYAIAPSVVWIGVAVGTAGLAAMVGLYAYTRQRPGTLLRRVVDNSVWSVRLQKAQAQLDEIRGFEREVA